MGRRRWRGITREEMLADPDAVPALMAGLERGACRLTTTPVVEETNVSWLDDRHVIFRTDSPNNDAAQSALGTVLELPGLQKSPR